LDSFIRHISVTYDIPIENIAVVSQSVGSVLAATWAHDYAPQIRCMVLAVPAFRVKLHLPFARAVLKVLHTLLGDFHVNSYVKPWALTHDPERIASYKADPLITRPISVRLLLGLYSASRRVIADAQAIQIPTQLLTSNSDWVVSTRPQLEFFKRLGVGAKEKHVFDGLYHDLLGEKDRHVVMEKVRAFILKMFACSYQKPLMLEADKDGYTKTEFDALTQPLPRLAPQRLGFALLKLGMKTGGRLSDGIRLGLETGFDSGSTLDYVYRNRASGITPVGKLLDWFFLHAIGWRGIRQRKSNIVKALLHSMEQLRAEGRPVRILDIAAGQGRYIFEALQRGSCEADSVLLRDFSEINVRLGSAFARENGLEDIFRFEQGDAFDKNALAEIRPRPTLGVVSGLYELFPDNAPVRESLAGLRQAIEPGGFLIYTGQPYHPQLEMIARTLSSHRSGPWIMRRRTQAELDQLVEAAGFEKVQQWIDDWGMFSVSIARRIGRHE
ncbi:MAG TPA: class I SAM-dependent methyltransferase family protein, partial [Terriglobales bacterium]